MIFDDVIPNGGADYVILSSMWSPSHLEDVEATLAYLANFDVEVVLFGPVPTYQYPLPEVLFRGRDSPDLDAYAERFLTPGKRELNEQMRRLAQARGVAYFDFFEVLCATGRRCRALTDDGGPMLWDISHLTPEGSAEIMTRARDEGLLLFPPLASHSDVPVTGGLLAP